MPTKEAPYRRRPRLLPCLQTPPTLYELTAAIVDSLPLPRAFKWSEEEVATWMEEVVGYPEYRDCILENHINGLRLLFLEDPSNLPEINIHVFEHIKKIVAHVRKEYSTDFIKFARSVGVPPRKPLTHITWFKSRTGPTWGIRQNWTRCDVLRWMKIIDPEPVYMNHWDLVWYQKPDFPKTLFGRIPKYKEPQVYPHYVSTMEECTEYRLPRRFSISREVPSDDQFIWLEHRPGSPSKKPSEVKKAEPKPKPVLGARLMPKKISLTGLTGKDLILARRLMPKPKFLAR
ncbi:uncharacterized protein LOC142985599 [Anticarsia gemmatalis]|uniref:uncharacterized protein LOC142985599 n=1 Tax=Anticarsia gemmatalis TaxID=129554 RepID=UPI003F7742AF